MSKQPKRPEHLQHKKMPQQVHGKAPKAKHKKEPVMRFDDGVSETLHCMLQPDDYLRLGDPVRSARGFGGQDTAVMKLECSQQITIPLASAAPTASPAPGTVDYVQTNTLCIIALPTGAPSLTDGADPNPAIGYYTVCYDEWTYDGANWAITETNLVPFPMVQNGAGELQISTDWSPLGITLNEGAYTILADESIDQRVVGGFLRFAYPTVQTQATVANCFVSDTGPDGMLPVATQIGQPLLIPMSEALGNCRRTTVIESTYEEPGALIRYVGQAGSACEFYTPPTFASLFADQTTLNVSTTSQLDRLRRQLRMGLARLSAAGSLTEGELDEIISGTGEVSDAPSANDFRLTPGSETLSGMFISSADGTQTITGVVSCSFQVEYVQNRQISGELHPTIPLDRFAGVQSLSLNCEFASGPHSFKSFLKSAWSAIKKVGKWAWGHRKEIADVAKEVAKLAA